MTFAKRYLEARAGGYADRLYLQPGDWAKTASELCDAIDRLRAELAEANDEIDAARDSINRLGTEAASRPVLLAWQASNLAVRVRDRLEAKGTERPSLAEIEAVIRMLRQFGEFRAPLAWTREKPTEPGLYLVRTNEAQWWDVYTAKMLSMITSLNAESDTEFAGPIPLPGEPEKGT